jgi:hypothetical protein
MYSTRKSLFAASVIFVMQMSAGNAADVLFDDTFSSFALGTNWEVPTYLNGNQCNLPNAAPCTFLGAPNVNLKVAYSGLRVTSAQADVQETGIGTVRTFRLNNGSVEVTFQTGAMSDPALTLPPGTNRANIDGVIGLELFNQTTGAAVFAQIYGGDYGTKRSLCLRSSAVCSPGPADWQYGASYRLLFTSKGNNTNALLEDTNGRQIVDYSLPISLHDIGDFHVVLTQNMGTPLAAYYNDVFVKEVKVVRGNQ